MHRLGTFNNNSYNRTGLSACVLIGGSCRAVAVGSGLSDNPYAVRSTFCIVSGDIILAGSYVAAVSALTLVIPVIIFLIISKGIFVVMAKFVNSNGHNLIANIAEEYSCAVYSAGRSNHIYFGMITICRRLSVLNGIRLNFYYLAVNLRLGMRIVHIENYRLTAVFASEYAVNAAVRLVAKRTLRLVTGDLDVRIIAYAVSLAIVELAVFGMNVRSCRNDLNYGEAFALICTGIGDGTFFLAGRLYFGYSVIFKIESFGCIAVLAITLYSEDRIIGAGFRTFGSGVLPFMIGYGNNIFNGILANRAVVDLVTGRAFTIARCSEGVYVAAVSFNFRIFKTLSRHVGCISFNNCISGLGVRNTDINNYRPAAIVAGKYCVNAFTGAGRSLAVVACKFHTLGKGIYTGILKNFGSVDRFAVKVMITAGKFAVEFNGKAGLFIGIGEVSVHLLGAVNIGIGYSIFILGKVRISKLRKLNYYLLAASIAECSSFSFLARAGSSLKSDLINVVALRSKLFELNITAVVGARIYYPTALAKGAAGHSYFEPVVLVVVNVLAGCRNDIGLFAGSFAAVNASLNRVALAHASRSYYGRFINMASGNVNDLSPAAIVADLKNLTAN